MTPSEYLPSAITVVVNVATVAYFVGSMRAELRDVQNRYLDLGRKIDDLFGFRNDALKEGGGLAVELKGLTATRARVDQNHDDMIRMKEQLFRANIEREKIVRDVEHLQRQVGNLAKGVGFAPLISVDKGSI